jgi:hypothetical protein
MAIEVGLLGPTPKAPELAHLDFVYAELKRLGYDAAVFAFESTLPNDKVGQASPDHDADVLVTNTENRVQKHYRSSSTLVWSDRFCEDLRAGRYGPAPRGVPFHGAAPRAGSD